MRDDPHEPAERARPFRKDTNDEAFLVAVNEALAECALPEPSPRTEPDKLPVVYIVGAPRSGTTLLSQIASRHLPLGYVDNVVARFWRRPSVGIRLSRMLLGLDARHAIAFESKHGVSGGAAGPHEFGYFWRHWLPLDQAANHHLPPALLARVDVAGLRSALENEMLATFGSGMVLKNVICGFHAAFLTRLHENSLFVHVVRDPYDTCASILRSRAERYGSYGHWWSLKPSTYPFADIAGDPAGEVVRQVLDCRCEIAASIAAPGVASITVRYDDLCADPSAAVEAICNALARLGADVRPLSTDYPQLRATLTPVVPEALASGLRRHLKAAARPMKP